MQKITALELLGQQVPEGAQAKAITDNTFYGTTVVKRNGTLVNVRTNEALPFTAELLSTTFKPVSTEKEVTLEEFLAAYEAGVKVKVEIEDKYRFLQKETIDIPEHLRGMLKHIHADFDVVPMVLTQNSVIMMEELIKGKFYIAE